MFESFGTAALTLASEEVLLESSTRSSSIHAGGWVGFKPSEYGSVSYCPENNIGEPDSSACIMSRETGSRLNMVFRSFVQCFVLKR